MSGNMEIWYYDEMKKKKKSKSKKEKSSTTSEYQRDQRDQIVGDAYARGQANELAREFAKNKPDSKFKIKYERSTDGKDKKHGWKAKVIGTWYFGSCFY